MDRGTGLYWVLVVLLLGSSLYFGVRVVQRDMEGASNAADAP